MERVSRRKFLATAGSAVAAAFIKDTLLREKRFVKVEEGYQVVRVSEKEGVVLKAAFQPDLRAIVRNIGRPEGLSGNLRPENPNSPNSKMIDSNNFANVHADFEGTSPRPDESSLRNNFAGIKWYSQANGDVWVAYPAPKPNSDTVNRWSFAGIRN